jgi:hypothetical protein
MEFPILEDFRHSHTGDVVPGNITCKKYPHNLPPNSNDQIANQRYH